MPMHQYRLARNPSGAQIRALEMLHDLETLAQSTHFALEVAGMNPLAREMVAEAIDGLQQARQVIAGGLEL